MLLALLPTSNLVTQLVVAGEWSSTQIKQGMALCMGGCVQLGVLMRKSLTEIEQEAVPALQG